MEANGVRVRIEHLERRQEVSEDRARSADAQVNSHEVRIRAQEIEIFEARQDIKTINDVSVPELRQELRSVRTALYAAAGTMFLLVVAIATLILNQG